MTAPTKDTRIINSPGARDAEAAIRTLSEYLLNGCETPEKDLKCGTERETHFRGHLQLATEAEFNALTNALSARGLDPKAEAGSHTVELASLAVKRGGTIENLMAMCRDMETLIDCMVAHDLQPIPFPILPDATVEDAERNRVPESHRRQRVLMDAGLANMGFFNAVYFIISTAVQATTGATDLRSQRETEMVLSALTPFLYALTGNSSPYILGRNIKNPMDPMIQTRMRLKERGGCNPLLFTHDPAESGEAHMDRMIRAVFDRPLFTRPDETGEYVACDPKNPVTLRKLIEQGAQITVYDFLMAWAETWGWTKLKFIERPRQNPQDDPVYQLGVETRPLGTGPETEAVATALVMPIGLDYGLRGAVIDLLGRKYGLQIFSTTPQFTRQIIHENLLGVSTYAGLRAKSRYGQILDAPFGHPARGLTMRHFLRDLIPLLETYHKKHSAPGWEAAMRPLRYIDATGMTNGQFLLGHLRTPGDVRRFMDPAYGFDPKQMFVAGAGKPLDEQYRAGDLPQLATNRRSPVLVRVPELDAP